MTTVNIRNKLYLHGDVCDGGGGQVKVVLNKHVEFGGQVPSSPNTVHLADQHVRNLEVKDTLGVIAVHMQTF